jgi:hypothetical protein
MTTSFFTTEARREATRDGAPAIDLVDGEALCQLLKDLRLGIKVRMVEEIGQLRQLMECEVNNALAQTVLVEDGRTLQDLVREMLRPMLKSWLDNNLPTVVERRDRADSQ